MTQEIDFKGLDPRMQVSMLSYVEGFLRASIICAGMAGAQPPSLEQSVALCNEAERLWRDSEMARIIDHIISIDRPEVVTYVKPAPGKEFKA